MVLVMGDLWQSALTHQPGDAVSGLIAVSGIVGVFALSRRRTLGVIKSVILWCAAVFVLQLAWGFVVIFWWATIPVLAGGGGLFVTRTCQGLPVLPRSWARARRMRPASITIEYPSPRGAQRRPTPTSERESTGMPVASRVHADPTHPDLAEIAAAAWMRELGFTDAVAEPKGPDGGRDVNGENAVAEVKHRGEASGIAMVERIHQVASAEAKHALFFSLADARGPAYTSHAVRKADELGVALFAYTLTNDWWACQPESKHAERLLVRPFASQLRERQTESIVSMSGRLRRSRT